MFLLDFLNRREINLLDALENLNGKERHKPLYDMLTVLDSKSASLMVFNSVIAIVTAEPFFTSLKIDNRILIIILLMTSISSVFSFFVVRITWPFLGKALDYDVELRSLAKEVDRRTCWYQISWSISFLAVFILIMSIGYHLFHYL